MLIFPGKHLVSQSQVLRGLSQRDWLHVSTNLVVIITACNFPPSEYHVSHLFNRSMTLVLELGINREGDIRLVLLLLVHLDDLFVKNDDVTSSILEAKHQSWNAIEVN